MQRRTRTRVVITIALLAFAVVIARLAPPGVFGFVGIRVIQQPVAATAAGVGAWLTAIADVVRDPNRVVALEHELAALRSEHATLERALLECSADAAERVRTYPEWFGVPIVGRVIAATFGPKSQVVVVAHQETDRFRAGNPVLAAGALIGVVAVPGRTRTTVRLLTDPQLRVGAERSNAPGVLGILEADTGGGLAVTHIPNDRTVTAGDAVVTGATAPGIPRGIPVGIIAAVRMDPDGFFQTAALDPIADPRRALVVTMLARNGEE